MSIVEHNVNFSLTFSLTYLKIFGLWAPEELTGWKRTLYHVYAFFMFMLLLGTYIAVQLAELAAVWGELALMTSTGFVLGTNLVHALKVLNVLLRAPRLRALVACNHRALAAPAHPQERRIVQRCNHDTNVHLATFVSLTSVTLVGFALGAALDTQDRQLPLRAWYPYPWQRSPYYEVTYAHQVCAIYLAALLNVSKDLLLVSLVAQSRARLALLRHRLASLGGDLDIRGQMVTAHQEEIIYSQLRQCIVEHEGTLWTVREIEACFSEPTLAQFGVSLVIICVTAFQLTSQRGNWVRAASMATYLLNMTEQLYIYCYEGTLLSAESEQVSRSAYSFPWYRCGVRVRRGALLLMSRCARLATLTAAGFTTLSLASFMSIIKASYTFFTVLRQVNEKNSN